MKDRKIYTEHQPLFFIVTIMFAHAYGQVDTGTVYKNLEVKKFYSVSLDAGRHSDGKFRYRVNQREVDKATYEKFESTWTNMETCCPCILLSYNENDVLISEAVSCTDAIVGRFKYFYPNGKIQISGQYKENSTGNWDNLCDRGYCQVENGQWVFFNESGDTLYSEFWKDGEFIKQVPPTGKMELWKLDVIYNGKSIDKQTLTMDDLKKVEFIPYFKNDTRKKIDLTIRFEVSANGHRKVEIFFNIDNFKNINVAKMLKEAEITSDTKGVSFSMWIYDEKPSGQSFKGGYYYLDIDY